MIFLGIDSCSADSGGPLMLERKEKGRKNYTLVGIVSSGPSPCGKENDPGMYTDVSFFLKWILDNLQ